jgi:hypothetical protein
LRGDCWVPGKRQQNQLIVFYDKIKQKGVSFMADGGLAGGGGWL